VFAGVARFPGGVKVVLVVDVGRAAVVTSRPVFVAGPG
jgi:hypothetical protein